MRKIEMIHIYKICGSFYIELLVLLNLQLKVVGGPLGTFHEPQGVHGPHFKKQL